MVLRDKTTKAELFFFLGASTHISDLSRENARAFLLFELALGDKVAQLVHLELLRGGLGADDPGVLQDLRGVEALLGVLDEQVLHEVLGLVRDGVPALAKLVLARHDLLEQRGVVVGVEGRVAHQQDVHNHTDAPHVHGLVVRLALEHLRCHVAGRAARGHHLLITKVLRQTEIGNLDHLILARAERQKILRLEK
jgi:hypothetical protein